MLEIPKTSRRTRDQLPRIEACAWHLRLFGRNYLAKRWRTLEDCRIWVPLLSRWIVVYSGFRFDKTSVSFNLRDYVPSLVHDFLYQHRIFEDGTPLVGEGGRAVADMVFFYLNEQSWLRFARFAGEHRLAGVGWFGRYVWGRREWGDPIPDYAAHLYGDLPWNKAA